MGTHVVVNPDLLTFTTMEKAFLDVSGEPASAEVTYTIYQAGAAPRTVKVPMNAKNFATSPDLFALCNKKTALIVAATTAPTTPSAAVLHQHLGSGAKAAITVPTSNRMEGRSFNLPVSDLSGGGTLFLGNPNGTAASAVIQFGSSTAPAAGNVTVPPLGVQTFKITQAEANLIVTVTNNVPIVVQAALGNRFLVVLPIGPAV